MSEDNVVTLNTGKPKEELFVLAASDIATINGLATDIIADGANESTRDAAAAEIMSIVNEAKPLNSGEAG